MTAWDARREDSDAYQKAVWAEPVGWMKAALGVRLWARQAEIARAVRDNPRVAVRSSNAVGKSFLAACLCIWYLEAHCPAYVVTTSSSWRGVERVLWPEIRRLVRGARSALGGELLRTEWRRGEQWAAFGVSADVPENFAGFRTAHGVFVIVDEASAIMPEIYDAIMGLTAGAGSRVLMIGNPLRPHGPFYDAFRSPAWAGYHISAQECPNVVEGRQAIPGLATREWIQERREEWGESSPAYQARVLGEFPQAGDDQLIPLYWAEQAIEREAPSLSNGGPLRMGVDVARYGMDRTVLVIRDAAAVRHLEWHTREDTMTTTGRVLSTARARGIAAGGVFVDDAGLGGGVTDRLAEQGFRVRAINFGHGARDPERFANVRSESYWNLREALNPQGGSPDGELAFAVRRMPSGRHGQPLAVPRQWKALAYECTVPRIGYTSRGQIKLESKDDIRRRVGRSTDLADALALTYAAAADTSVWIGI